MLYTNSPIKYKDERVRLGNAYIAYGHMHSTMGMAQPKQEPELHYTVGDDCIFLVLYASYKKELFADTPIKNNQNYSFEANYFIFVMNKTTLQHPIHHSLTYNCL